MVESKCLVDYMHTPLGNIIYTTRSYLYYSLHGAKTIIASCPITEYLDGYYLRLVRNNQLKVALSYPCAIVQMNSFGSNLSIFGKRLMIVDRDFMDFINDLILIIIYIILSIISFVFVFMIIRHFSFV